MMILNILVKILNNKTSCFSRTMTEGAVAKGQAGTVAKTIPRPDIKRLKGFHARELYK